MRRFLMGVPALFCLTGGCQPEPPARAAPVPIAVVPASVDAVRQRRAAVTEALRLAVGSDPEGLELLAFVREQARYVTLSERGRYLVDGRPDAEVPIPDDGLVRGYFYIDVSDQAQRTRFGLGGESAFRYSPQRSTLFLPSPAMFTQLWFGVMYAHELRHAEDHLTGAERVEPGEHRGEEYMRGEARAHSLEIRLIDRVTRGDFVRQLDAILDAELPPGANDDPRIYIATAAVQQRSVLLNRLFEPARTPTEWGHRLGSYAVALNFRFADRQAVPAAPLERRARLYEKVTRGQPAAPPAP